MRTLQEWMGDAQLQTTEIYADYAPSSHEKEMVERAFARPTTTATIVATAPRQQRPPTVISTLETTVLLLTRMPTAPTGAARLEASPQSAARNCSA